MAPLEENTSLSIKYLLAMALHLMAGISPSLEITAALPGNIGLGTLAAIIYIHPTRTQAIH